MQRITKDDVRRRVAVFQKWGFNIGTDSAYGKDSISNIATSRQYAPRATASENYHFVLNGFTAGVNAERERVKTKCAAFVAWLQDHKDMPEVAAYLETLNETIG